MNVVVTDSKGGFPESKLDYFIRHDAVKYLFKITSDDGSESSVWMSPRSIDDNADLLNNDELYYGMLDAIDNYIENYNKNVDEIRRTSDIYFIATDIKNDILVSYELYIDGKLDSTGDATYLIWSENDRLKNAWEEAVRKYKDEHEISYPSKELETKASELKDAAEKQDAATMPKIDTAEIVPISVETAVAMASTDPCNFVSSLIQGMKNGNVSLKDIAQQAKKSKSYVKKKGKETAAFANTSKAATVIQSEEGLEGFKEYYKDLDAKKEAFEKEHAQTIALFKVCEKENTSKPVMSNDIELPDQTYYDATKTGVTSSDIKKIQESEVKSKSYFTLKDMLKSSTADKRGIKNIPTAEHLPRLQETLAIGNRIAAIWEAYCKQRGWKNSKLIMSSGYRCPELNRAVGGSSTSAHATGYAMDLLPANGKTDELCDVIYAYCNNKENNLKFDQVLNEYNTSGSHWMHFGYKNNAGGQRGMYCWKYYASGGSGGRWKYLA